MQLGNPGSLSPLSSQSSLPFAHAPIYLAEEQIDAARTLPRSIIGGALLVTVCYFLINLAFLRVLSLPVLAASDLPASDVARIVLPRGGAAFVTVVSLLTVLSLLNNVMLMAPRILFALGRDGLLPKHAAVVSIGGTPRVSLATTSVISSLFILTDTFEQIIALTALLALLCYVSAFLAVIVLRKREPAALRGLLVAGCVPAYA